ncbi:hypothetical protein ACROYT_G014779 [Oculina patagonica]
MAKGLPTIDTNPRMKPGRKTGPPCKCTQECFQLINEVERRWLLRNFKAIADFSIQNVYLRGLIITEPKVKGHDIKSYTYHVQTSDLVQIKHKVNTIVEASMSRAMGKSVDSMKTLNVSVRTVMRMRNCADKNETLVRKLHEVRDSLKSNEAIVAEKGGITSVKRLSRAGESDTCKEGEAQSNKRALFVESDFSTSTGTFAAALRARDATTQVDFGDFHDEESNLTEIANCEESIQESLGLCADESGDINYKLDFSLEGVINSLTTIDLDAAIEAVFRALHVLNQCEKIFNLEKKRRKYSKEIRRRLKAKEHKQTLQRLTMKNKFEMKSKPFVIPNMKMMMDKEKKFKENQMKNDEEDDDEEEIEDEDEDEEIAEEDIGEKLQELNLNDEELK